MKKTKLLNGVRSRCKVVSLIKQNFASVDANGKNIPVRKAGLGRPFNRNIRQVANDYLSTLPQDMQIELNENPDLLASFITSLSNYRRKLTAEEKNYIENSRDAKAMGILDGEIAQLDIYNSYVVARKAGETLGTAVRRRYSEIVDFVQAEADRQNVTLYVILTRFSAERNLRDVISATKYEAPLTAVGLMSKNIATIIVTDKMKNYKGSLGVMAVLTPQPLVLKPQRKVKQSVQEPIDTIVKV